MRSQAPPVLDAVHRLVTPESVEFEFPLAGLYSRALAWLIDRIAIALFFIGALFALYLVLAAAPQLASATAFVLYFVLDWGYSMLFETLWRGQTPGKRVMGLRVLRESGVRVGFEQAALRNLARAVDGLPFLYAVGGLFALFTGKSQRLGDLLAGTIVVRERALEQPHQVARPDGDAAPPDAFLPQRVARLGHDERALVLAAVGRRDELSIEARLMLFEQLSERLEDSLALARPSHLSAEKWCQWIAATLSARSDQLNQTPSVRPPP